jgi:hypothetical protein
MFKQLWSVPNIVSSKSRTVQYRVPRCPGQYRNVQYRVPRCPSQYRNVQVPRCLGFVHCRVRLISSRRMTSNILYKNIWTTNYSTMECVDEPYNGRILDISVQRSPGSIYTGIIKNTYRSTFESYIKELLVQKYWQLISTKQLWSVPNIVSSHLLFTKVIMQIMKFSVFVKNARNLLSVV